MKNEITYVILTLIITSLFMSLINVVQVNAAGEYWLYGWMYRKSITITGSTAGAVSNYAIRVIVNYSSGTDSGNTVYVSGKCRTDFGDIRFTGSDGQTLLPYWMESKVDGSHAIFWVKVPSIPASPGTAVIYIYYGNPSATYDGNGDNVFLFFDDFTVFNNTKWMLVYSSGTYGISNGVLYLRAGNGQKMVIAQNVNNYPMFSTGIMLEFRGQIFVGQRSGSHSNIGLSSDGTKPNNANLAYVIATGNFSNDEVNDAVVLSYINNLIGQSYGGYTGNGFGVEKNNSAYSLDGTINIDNSTYYIYSIGYIPGSKAVLYIDRVLRSTITSNVPNVPLGISFTAYVLTGYAATVTHYIDYVFVRRYVDPEPSITAWGAEMVAPRPPTIISPTANYRFSPSSTINVSWAFNPAFDGDYQTAYRITIYNSTTTIVDTGQINSSSTSTTITVPSTAAVGQYNLTVTVWNSAEISISNTTTIIIDLVVPQSITTTRQLLKVNESEIIYVKLIYAYDSQPVTCGTFSINGSQLIYDSVKEVWIANYTQNAVGVAIFNNISGNECIWNLSAANPNRIYDYSVFVDEAPRPYGFYYDAKRVALLNLTQLINDNIVFSDLRDVYVSGHAIIYPNKTVLALGRLYLGGNPTYTASNTTFPNLPVNYSKLLLYSDLSQYKAFYRINITDEYNKPYSTTVILKHPLGDMVLNNVSHVSYDVKPGQIVISLPNNILRKYIPSYDHQDLKIALPPSGSNVLLYTIGFNDYAGLLNAGSIVRFYNLMSGEKLLADEEYLPTEKKVSAYLVYGFNYTISIYVPPDTEYALQSIIADDQTLKAVNVFPPRISEFIKLAYKYVLVDAYFDDDGALTVFYQDLLGGTQLVSIFIYDSNNQLLRQISYAGINNVTYRVNDLPSSNTYRIVIDVKHSSFGDFTVRRVVGSTALNIPNILSLPTSDPFISKIIPIMVIIAIAGSVGSAHAALGLLLAVFMTALFTYIKWLDIPYSAIGVIMVFAVMYVFERSKRGV